jgi:hypothetical protein
LNGSSEMCGDVGGDGFGSFSGSSGLGELEDNGAV